MAGTTMTRLLGPLQELRSARGKLALSWSRTAARWQDGRAREFEAAYQSSLEASATSFERALENLDREVDQAIQQLPD
jgi:uncharacterized protein YukE